MPLPGAEATYQGDSSYAKSRYNSMVDGLRSKLIHPELMQMKIDARALEFAVQLEPRTKLEGWLIKEMSRSSVQIDICEEQRWVNQKRVLNRVDDSWPDDCTARADKLGARLSDNPHHVAGALARTKYGALHLLGKWTDLESAIITNGGLDEAQMQVGFDLLGVDPVMRNGSRKLPASSDGPALLALVRREKDRLNTSLEKVLNGRDLAEQSAARLGITRFQDEETRRLRSNENRARKRFEWSKHAYDQLKAGVCPSSIIDPETGKHLDPEAHAAPAPAPEPAPATPSPSPSPSSPPDDSPPTESAPSPTPTPATDPAPSPPWMAAIPKDCSEEIRELHVVLGEAFLRHQPLGDLKLPPPDDSGPPSA